MMSSAGADGVTGRSMRTHTSKRMRESDNGNCAREFEVREKFHERLRALFLKKAMRSAT